jgi:glycerophosphoryl diester phosphodiesterase
MKSTPAALCGLVLTSIVAVTTAPDSYAGAACPVAAHRGDTSTGATENGMGAFWQASRDGVEVLEGDVRVSSNDGLVMMHDETVDRTTTAAGPVKLKTAREIHAIELNDGRHVPYLWQVLELARDRNHDALIHLKRMGTWLSYTRLATLIERYGVHRVVVQSRSTVHLARIRRLIAARTAVVTTSRLSREQVAAAGGVVVHHAAASDAWLDTMAGLAVYVWTVDDAEGWTRFAPRATVITNRPRAFITARSRFCT